MIYKGDFPTSHAAVTFGFATFAAATGAPSATTNFAAGDIQIYKDGSATQRSSSAGITVTASFDSQTGEQMVVIDLSDNTDAGFYAAGHEYDVFVQDITVDGQTLRFYLGAFSIERAGGVLALIKANTVKVDVNTIKTQAVTCAAGVTVLASVGTAATSTAQTGDSYVRIGAAGISLSAIPDLAGVTTLLSRVPSGIFTGITSLAQWLGLIAGKQTGNSTARTEVRATGAGSGTFDETTDSIEALRDNEGTAGAGLTAVGDTSGTTTLLSRLSSTRATNLDNLDAAVTTRTKPADTQAAVTLVTTTTNLTTNNDKTGYGLSAAAVQAIWDALTSALTTVGSIGKWIVDKLDVVVSTRLATSGYTAPPTAVQNRQEMDSNSTKLTSLQADTDDIQTRIPAALSGGNMKSDVLALNTSTAAAARIALSAGVIIPGTVDAGSFSATTTAFESDDVTDATADQYNGRVIIFTSGALLGQATTISDYVKTGSNGHFTVVALTSAPADNVTFVIV